jgi:hypothetical protein
MQAASGVQSKGPRPILQPISEGGIMKTVGINIGKSHKLSKDATKLVANTKRFNLCKQQTIAKSKRVTVKKPGVQDYRP